MKTAKGGAAFLFGYNPFIPLPRTKSCCTREIDLQTAVSEIKQACDDESQGSPFFIIAGAGVSTPSVPLANKIAKDCQEIAAKYDRGVPPSGTSPLDTYSHWLEKAFPHASARQRYFKRLIEKKPITHANFRLAHLLSEKRLATLVVTPNFDDFLSRSLTLFGQPHIICDHPNTVDRIDPESPEIQIVHVHGTYWFYDCCNLRGEIEARSKDSRERAETMTSLLDKIMSRHSPIVIGYSGWEGDVIMTALKRRLNSGLPNNLYWFCFQRNGLDSLRAFLNNHRDACLVLPATLPSLESPSTSTEENLVASSGAEPTLPAQLVLDELVRTFTEQAPQLTLDPIGFFAGQLRNSFPTDPGEKPGDDIYKLGDVLRRVERVREAGESLSEIEREIERVTDAVRRSSYQEAIRLATPLASESLTLEQRETLIDSAFSAATGLLDNSQSELDGYDLVLALATGAAATRPTVREQTATALVNKGLTLSALNRDEEEVLAYDELLLRFGGATEPALQEQVAKALVYKGMTLGHLNRGEEAIQTYDEVVRRFGDATEPALREQVAVALGNKGFRLGRLNRDEEAIKAFDEVLRRFGDATEPAFRGQAARALLNKGFRLGKLDRNEEAVRVYDELLQRFGDATELADRERLAIALRNKGLRLGQLDRGEEAIQTFDELLRRFGDAAELALREQVAKALLNKGFRLGQLDRGDEAIQTFDEVLRRFGDSSEAGVIWYVQQAKSKLEPPGTTGELPFDQRENP